MGVHNLGNTRQRSDREGFARVGDAGSEHYPYVA